MTSKILRADGTTELASIQTVTYHESVNADTDLRPGCVASSYIEVTCFGAQSDAPDVGEALTYYQVVGETETLIGIFYAEPSIPTKNSYKFVAYDAINKLDADFSAWLSANQANFPYTVYQLVSQACSIAGLTLGSSSWSNSTMSVNAWYADGLTCRNILQYAAEIACKFVRCNTDGEIVFDWYKGAASGDTKTASGTIATFDDGADRVPLKSLTAQITPVQDLHGYDSPWPAGGGKNKIDTRNINVTVAGITATSDADGIISLTGTRNTSTGWKPIASYNLPAGNYVFSSSNPHITCLVNWTQKPGKLTVADGDVVRLALSGMVAGDVINDTGIKVQIEPGSTATAWTPYSNICPISGHTSTDVWDDPKYSRNVKWNQKLKNPHFTEGTGGLQYWSATRLTLQNNNDGSVALTVNAISESTSYYNLLSQHISLPYGTENHKFLVLLDYKPKYTQSVAIFLIRSSETTGNTGMSLTATGGVWNRLAFFVPGYNKTYNILQLAMNTTVQTGYAVGDVVYVRYPNLFDLTEMFGAGNEPTTLDEFKALFPNDCYDYNSGEVTCVSAVSGDPYRHVQVSWEDETGTVYDGELTINEDGSCDVTADCIGIDLSTITNWQVEQNMQRIYIIRNDIAPASSSSTVADKLICNRFKSISFDQLYGNKEQGVAISIGKALQLHINGLTDDPNVTLAIVNQYFQDNQTFVVAKLATPVVHHLPSVEMLSTVLGTNNIWTTAGDIEVEYYPTLGRIYPSSGTDESGDRFAYKQDGLTYDNYDTSAVTRVAVHPVGEDEVAYYYPTNVTSGNTLNITNNALLYGASSTDMLSIAQSIYATMTAFGTYRPMSVEMFPNECPFKPGDIVPVTDAQGVSFTTAIMEKTVTDSAVTLTSTGREVYGDYALDTAKRLVQLASDIVRINKLKVGWAEIDEAVVGVLTSIGMNPDEVVVSANTVTEYYLSTSSSSATGGSWGTSIPTWSSGKYVWTRDKTTNEYADGTSSTTYSPSQNGVYDANLTTALSTAASASSAASAAQTAVNGANQEEQLIYKTFPSGTSSVSPITTWVTNTGDQANTWTKKRPSYNANYPVLFVATQRKTVGGTITCTTPLKDDNSTTISGGQITTGTIDASRVNVTNINADNITTGALTVRDANNNIIFQADAANKTAQIGAWVASATALKSVDSVNAMNMVLGDGRIKLQHSEYQTYGQTTIYGAMETLGSTVKGPRLTIELCDKTTLAGGLQITGSGGSKIYYWLRDWAGASYNVTHMFYGELAFFDDTYVQMANPSAWRTAIGAVNKAGDTMTGSLTLGYGNLFIKNSSAESGVVPSSTIWGERVCFRDKNNSDIGYVHIAFATDGRQGVCIRARRDVNGSPQDNALTLYQKADGTRSVAVDDAGAWRTALGAVNKAGDTMTGHLVVQNTGPIVAARNTTMDTTATSQSAATYATHAHYDKNSRYAGYWQTSQGTDGTIYTRLAARRYLNSENVDNYLILGIANNGEASVIINQSAAWRSALGFSGATITAIANALSVATGTWKNVKSMTFSAGTWLVIYHCEFGSNATGRRCISFAKSLPNDAAAYNTGTQIAAANGSKTILSFEKIITLSANTSYIFGAFQNSGSSINIDASVEYIRLA